jgi:hypothetical protein
MGLAGAATWCCICVKEGASAAIPPAIPPGGAGYLNFLGFEEYLIICKADKALNKTTLAHESDQTAVLESSSLRPSSSALCP